MTSWGQLAYTSTRGGFGVHAESGLSAEQRDVLVAGAYPGRGSFGQDVPLLADPAQVAGFHRNLSYRRHADLGGCYWHSAPAGADESGRTGNCFVHALLDQATDGDNALGRPIEFWRSPSMLAPYGSAAVKAATLPTLPPEPGQAVTRQQVVDFLTSFEVDRLSTFTRLIEAIATPRRQPLVLGVATPDEGALWVAGLSYLLAPSAARDLSFSVWEAPELLVPDRLPDVEVLCVEESRIPAQLDDLGLLILRPSQLPPAAGSDGDGLASAFAQSASHLFSLTPAEIIKVLVDIDKVCAQVRLRGAHRAWPLAMAMAENLDLWPYLQPHITGVLLQTTPSTIETSRTLWDRTERLIKERSTGRDRDPASMRDDAQKAAPGPLRTMLHQAYVEAAAQQPDWYADPANRRSTGASGQDVRLDGDVESDWYVAARAALASMPTPDAALHITWLCHFLLTEGWSGGFLTENSRTAPPWGETARRRDPQSIYRRQSQPSDEPAEHQDATITGDSVEGDQRDDAFDDLREILGDPRMARRFVAEVGDLSARTKQLLLRPMVVDILRDPEIEHPDQLEDRLSPALVDLLVPRSDLAFEGSDPSLTDPLVGVAFAQRLEGPDGAALASTLAWALGRQDSLDADPSVVKQLLPMLRDSDLHGQEVAKIIERHGSAVDNDLLVRTLAVSSAQDLRELVQRLFPRRAAISSHARNLVTMAHEPIMFLPRHGGSPHQAALAGLGFLNRAAETAVRTGPHRPQKLSSAWACTFDLFVSLSSPDDWLTRRHRLFDREVPVEPSAEFIAHQLGNSDCQDRYRDQLHEQLLFNAWYAAEWPERVSGSRQRRDTPTPFQAGAELILRPMHEDDRTYYLDSLLATIESRVPKLPFPSKAAVRDTVLYRRSAEAWFRRTTRATVLQQVGNRFRIGGKRP